MAGEQIAIEELEKRLTQKGAPYALVPGADGLRCFAHGPQRLSDIAQLLARRGERKFIVDGRRRLSFASISRQAETCGTMLVRRHGSMEGKRVALAANNSADWVVWFFAILAAGATPVLAPVFRPDRIADRLHRTDCGLAIADADARRALMQGNYRGNVMPLECCGTISILPMETASVPPPVSDADPGDEALVTFTSGSTGDAKPISQSHRGITTGLMNMMLAGALAGGARRRSRDAAGPCALILAPLSHSIGYSQLLLAVVMGMRLIPCARSDVADIASLVRSEQVTSIVGLDRSRLENLLWRPDAASELKSIRSWNFAGEEPHPALMERISAVTPQAVLTGGYGLTETNGGICAILGEDLQRGDGAAGRVVSSVEVKITDRRGKALPPDQRGMIWLRGNMLMRGYLDTDGQLSGIEDGWFCTGDEGVLSKHRVLAVLGRSSPKAASDPATGLWRLERWARRQDQVLDACAIGLRHGGKDHRILFIQPASGARELCGRLEAGLDGAGQGASESLILEQACFPRTGTGKVDRVAMAALARAYCDVLMPEPSDKRLEGWK